MAADPDSRRSDSLQRVASNWATCICGLVVGLCSWSYLGSVPLPTVDSSWAVGLQLAAANGLHFGPDVIFTYGPLGWLQQPTAAISPYPELGGLYIAAIQVGLGISLVWALRRSFPLWVAGPAALGLALIITLEPVIALTLLWCLVALGPEPPAAVYRWFAPLAGAISAVEMLGKLSVGPLLVVITALTVAAMDGPRRRRIGIFAASAVLTFAVLWTATGQSPADVGPYLRGTFEVVRGYTAAMPLIAGDGETIRIVAAIGFVLAGVGAAALATAGLPPRRRIVAPLVVALAGFAVWKMAFVRFGGATYPYLFAVILPPWIAFPWRRLGIGVRGRRIDARPLAALATLAIFVLFLPLTEQPLSRIDPVQRAKTGSVAFRDLVLPGRVDHIARESQANLADGYALDQRSLALLRGHTVAIDPAEILIAWVYGLDWRPLPVFQDYTAYTPYLDGVNHDALVGDDRPERVLRTFTVQQPRVLDEVNLSEAQTWNSYSNTDGRFSPWDQPRTNLAMLCTYRPLRTTRAYQVLAAGSDRCGEPRLLGELDTTFNQEFAVPQPRSGEVVYAEIEGLAPHGIETVRTLLYRAPLYFVRFNGSSLQYRLLPTDGPDKLLAAAPGTDFPLPFALAPQAETVTIEKEPTRLSGDGELRIRFYAMPMEPVPGSRRRSAPK